MNRTDDLVLLAEDNSTDALMVRRAFTKASIQGTLEVVEDGDKAVAYLSGKRPFADRMRHPLPVLLLLDLKLPRRSGLEVLAWIRQQPGLKRLPVVVLTSSEENSDINRAYDLGANSYLVKPVNFDALLEMIKGLGLYWLVLNEDPELENSR
jgi:CheY-like chemotaxis protein